MALSLKKPQYVSGFDNSLTKKIAGHVSCFFISVTLNWLGRLSAVENIVFVSMKILNHSFVLSQTETEILFLCL